VGSCTGTLSCNSSCDFACNCYYSSVSAL